MTRTHTQLALERLEDRTVPTSMAAIGPNPAPLVPRFDADSVQASGTTNDPLKYGESQVVGAASWQTRILQAFQNWASSSNAGISIVSDDGGVITLKVTQQGNPSLNTGGEVAGSMQPGEIGQETSRKSTGATETTEPVELLITVMQKTGIDPNPLATDQTRGVCPSPTAATPPFDMGNLVAANTLATTAEILFVEMSVAGSNPNTHLGFGAMPQPTGPHSTEGKHHHDHMLTVGPLLTDTDTNTNTTNIPDFIWTGQSFKATTPLSPLAPAGYA